MISSFTTRAIGVVFHNFSNGIFSRRPIAFILHSTFSSLFLFLYGISMLLDDYWNVFRDLYNSGTDLLSKGLSSASCFSSLDTIFGVNCNYNSQVRTIWTFPPVCMGRRSCKIAGRKVSFLSIVLSLCTCIRRGLFCWSYILLPEMCLLLLDGLHVYGLLLFMHAMCLIKFPLHLWAY